MESAIEKLGRYLSNDELEVEYLIRDLSIGDQDSLAECLAREAKDVQLVPSTPHPKVVPGQELMLAEEVVQFCKELEKTANTLEEFMVLYVRCSHWKGRLQRVRTFADKKKTDQLISSFRRKISLYRNELEKTKEDEVNNTIADPGNHQEERQQEITEGQEKDQRTDTEDEDKQSLEGDVEATGGLNQPIQLERNEVDPKRSTGAVPRDENRLFYQKQSLKHQQIELERKSEEIRELKKLIRELRDVKIKQKDETKKSGPTAERRIMFQQQKNARV